MAVVSKRIETLLVLSALSVCVGAAFGAEAEGKFKPDWDSLTQYECPDWYRDAKFGIWAHWSAQCVPEQGDWYAKHMYEQGGAQYNYHVEHYGHPSVFGFKDICNIWKAENWEPDRLIQLYKRAGAKYFVALANHHCNFDCWDSKYQPWNSVNIGPKKDIVGVWAEAARKEGLRFGVTVHCARSWSWYEVAQGSDKSGPLAGVPYDGALTKADGKGKWWEGYDPQDLYAQNHAPGAKPDQAYIDKFYNRVIDLVDSYKPDLLYFDDGVMPLNTVSDAGLRIASHYYNASMKWHDGRNEAVMNTKNLPEDKRKALVWDIERGRTNQLAPYPWQTDTCIGSWHYSRSLFESHKYKTATTVITMLVDIVSKNGNLLLNIPVRGDGTIDEDEEKVLEDLAQWMEVNSEAIFATRPWIIYGEGPTSLPGDSFNEKKAVPYTSDDIRFTAKGDALYVILLGWPEKQAVIRSLGKSSPLVQGEISDIRLLGHDGKLEWTRNEDGLVIQMPAEKPCEHAFAFKIAGLKTNASADVSNLPWVPKSNPETEKATASKKGKNSKAKAGKASAPNVGKAGIVVTPGADGSLTLAAEFAEMHGAKIQIESRGERPNIGFWDNPKEWASWKAKVAQAGTYQVSALVASTKPESEFVVEIAGQQRIGKAPVTGGWDTYQTVPLGKVEISEPGEIAVSVRPRDEKTWKAINLSRIVLIPAK
ncbi:MAG: alpha-L-fucosidase [Candidatus Sumerlaeota bacterium]|nr:alpha-L-fucosidase [Candidatus Sumerlaeota bacterium]